VRQLLLLLARYSNFFFFLFLEAIAWGLIKGSNAYQSAVFFTFTNSIASSFNSARASVWQYIYLQKQNDVLAEENALLLRRLAQRSQISDTRPDSVYTSGYSFIAARVIQNSVAFQNNFIILDKGTDDGIAPGMGVITANGVVGKIRSCTKNASLAYSFLHNDLNVSVRIKRLGVLGTLRWGRSNITEANLLYVGQHEKVALGDTIVTAGFNAVYPPDLPLGIISSINYSSSAIGGNAFLDLKVRLNINYAVLNHVYIVRHKLSEQVNNLKKQVAMPETD
jgi:rod shape-determining protein MreC